MEPTRGKLLTDIKDREAYKKTYPYLRGYKEDFPGLHELHVFLVPFFPNDDIVRKACDIKDLYNKERAEEFD